jgi:hypothetical protein
MDDMMIATHFENIDRRLARVEQILPTLATKEELRDAIAPLATKEELREEHAQLRLHMTMLIENQDSKLQLLAEHVLSVMAKKTEE